MAVIKKWDGFTRRYSMRITLNKRCVDEGPSSPLRVEKSAYSLFFGASHKKKNPASICKHSIVAKPVV